MLSMKKASVETQRLFSIFGYLLLPHLLTSDNERNDLLELKLFLERAIPAVNDQLMNFPANGSTDDYRFLIDKAIMYRESLKQVKQQLENDKES